MRAPKPTIILSPADAGRFSSNMDRSGGPEACWPWRGAADPYGRFKAQGKVHLAHRVAYTLATGDTAAGVVVRHACDNPLCCNPAHLESGTYSDNMADMLERGRGNPPRGADHPRAVANDNIAKAIIDSPLSGRAIASELGLAYGTVASIRSGRSWSHLPRRAA